MAETLKRKREIGPSKLRNLGKPENEPLTIDNDDDDDDTHIVKREPLSPERQLLAELTHHYHALLNRDAARAAGNLWIVAITNSSLPN